MARKGVWLAVLLLTALHCGSATPSLPDDAEHGLIRTLLETPSAAVQDDGILSSFESTHGINLLDLLTEKDPPASEDAPFNVTGSYRGWWFLQGNGPGKHSGSTGPLPDKGEGSLVFQLRAGSSSAATSNGSMAVVDVTGDMVMRNGQYVAASDPRFRLEGVFVPGTDRLRLAATPVEPMRVSVPPEDAAAQTGRYRMALMEAASKWIAATDAAGDGGLLQQQAPPQLQTECAFFLDLAASHPIQQSALGGSGNPPAAAGQGSAAAAALQELNLDPGEAAAVADILRCGEQTAAGASSSGLPDQVAWERCWRSSGDAALAAASPRNNSPSLLPASLTFMPFDKELVVLKGELYSRNCNLVVALEAVSVNLSAYYSKAMNYILMMTCVALVQIGLVTHQMAVTDTPAAQSGVSIATVAQLALLEAYLCLLHLTAGIMVEALFTPFMTVSLFEFALFAIFLMRYMLLIWRARHTDADAATVRREVGRIYTRFYATLLMGVLLGYQLKDNLPYLCFAAYSFWIPQIVLSVWKGSRQWLTPQFVMGVAVAKLVLPAYLLLCPKNLLRIQPRPSLFAALAAFQLVQVAVLALQYWFGPRSVIPRAFLPPRYDYHRPVGPPYECADEEAGGGEAGVGECVICMNPVSTSRLAARMVTPCHHFFHTSCLQRWMSVKLECPTCRQPLPPL